MYLAVCDDKKEDLDEVFSLLDAWQEERGTPFRCKAYQSTADLLEAARRERFTLYLLDVMMPDMNGLEAAGEIRRFDNAAEIVFLSAFPGFAYSAYERGSNENMNRIIRRFFQRRPTSTPSRRRRWPWWRNGWQTIRAGSWAGKRRKCFMMNT